MISLANEIEAELLRTLNLWFPRCIGDHGGFFQRFDRCWVQQPDSTLALVFQARMTWVLATVARRRPEWQPEAAAWARRGLEFIEQRFGDPRHGGLWFDTEPRDEKHSYGIAFALFAAAACARGGCAYARRFALELYDWWTERAFDTGRGTYADALDRAGRPVARSNRNRDLINVPYGMISANTQLHAIEALTELLLANDDDRIEAQLATLVERLEALVRRDGAFYTTYSPVWRPVDRTVSYGHDIEAVFLVLEARRCLGWSSDTPLLVLLRRSLRSGIDRRFGGMYFGRRGFRRLDHKVDWVQAEAFNTFAYLAAGSPESVAYRDALHNLWCFISDHLSDDVHGGWLGQLDRRGRILDDRKGHRWKACYHPVRALLNGSDLLHGKPPSAL